MRTLAILALHETDEYGAEELARLVGVTRPAVVDALKYLEGDGLVRHRTMGKKNLYRVVTSHALYPELKAIAVKTLGGHEAIAKEIQNDARVRFAAVFGSFARGDEDPESDIDVLFVIEDPDWEETDYRLASRMALVGSRIARTISPSIYRASEFHRLRREGSFAMTQILAAPMLVLKGSLENA